MSLEFIGAASKRFLAQVGHIEDIRGLRFAGCPIEPVALGLDEKNLAQGSELFVR